MSGGSFRRVYENPQVPFDLGKWFATRVAASEIVLPILYVPNEAKWCPSTGCMITKSYIYSIDILAQKSLYILLDCP